mmetsp:Transcript_17854/g.49530  ORF Transcript_17854/g.49530 Transcript_17854/m.49530 type:complete len:213 (+) Transcript_17854:54-692(+)
MAMFGGLMGPSTLPPTLRRAYQEAAVERQRQQQPQHKELPHDAASNGALLPAFQGGHTPQQQQQQHQELQQQQQQQLYAEHLNRVVQAIPGLIQEQLTAVQVQQYRSQPPPALVQPMQFIINNHTEAHTSQKTINSSSSAPQQPPREKESPSAMASWMSSPTNRLCLYSAIGLSLYILQGHLQTKWRGAELRRRLDANPMARLAQILNAAPR